ncbi:MAG: hypothetical protein QMD92_03770 [bacterium]|nr:hypothetical protein [bacterium]
MNKEILKEFMIFINLQAIVYFFFILAMINLSIFLKNTSETSYKEWKYLKTSLLVFTVWGIIVFVKTVFSIVNKTEMILSYILNTEPLVILIASILLFLGIYKVHQKMKKRFI